MRAVRWIDQHGHVRWQPELPPNGLGPSADGLGERYRGWIGSNGITYHMNNTQPAAKPRLYRWRSAALLAAHRRHRSDERAQNRSRWSEASA